MVQKDTGRAEGMSQPSVSKVVFLSVLSGISLTNFALKSFRPPAYKEESVNFPLPTKPKVCKDLQPYFLIINFVSGIAFTSRLG
jgi:hypothetical protein